jgi:HK97 family phage portal protein
VQWPFGRKQETAESSRRPVEQRTSYSISDPRLATLFQFGTANYSGVPINESTALGISAVYRAVSLISGTLSQLPMRTLRELAPGLREPVPSWMDTPGGPDGPTPFEWKETVLLHLLLHGNAFLLHNRGGAGQLISLTPVHPLCVSVEKTDIWPNGDPVVGGKLFTVVLEDEELLTVDGSKLLHIPGMCTDGIRGISPISMARQSMGTAVAGDRAAANMFSRGSMVAGLVSVDGEDVEEEDAKAISDALERNVSGWENASTIRFVNRKVKFTPWTMSSVDMQFLESRQFQIEEIARWFGVPPHLLMQTDKQTSWGTGVAESNRGMGRTVLAPWASRIEQRLSRLLWGEKFVEFDFSGLERPSPEIEIGLLAQKIEAGMVTINEARSALNLPPVSGGDVLRLKGVPLVAELSPSSTGAVQ